MPPWPALPEQTVARSYRGAGGRPNRQQRGRGGDDSHRGAVTRPFAGRFLGVKLHVNSVMATGNDKPRGNARMLGLMQEWHFLCHRVIEHAAKFHGTQEVVTRSVEGTIYRTNDAQIH